MVEMILLEIGIVGFALLIMAKYPDIGERDPRVSAKEYLERYGKNDEID